MATAVAAHFLGVNPFDQPDVEATKKHTRAVIADYKEKKNMTDEKPALTFETRRNLRQYQWRDTCRSFYEFFKTVNRQVIISVCRFI